MSKIHSSPCLHKKKKLKNIKKLLTCRQQSGIIILPLRVGFFVLPECAMPKGSDKHCSVREVHRFFRAEKSNNLKWEVPLIWLMMQESKLLWYALSASRETMTQRRTRRMTLTDLKCIERYTTEKDQKGNPLKWYHLQAGGTEKENEQSHEYTYYSSVHSIKPSIFFRSSPSNRTHAFSLICAPSNSENARSVSN